MDTLPRVDSKDVSKVDSKDVRNDVPNRRKDIEFGLGVLIGINAVSAIHLGVISRNIHKIVKKL